MRCALYFDMTFLTENKCILQKIFSSDKELSYQLVTSLPQHPGSLAPHMLYCINPLNEKVIVRSRAFMEQTHILPIFDPLKIDNYEILYSKDLDSGPSMDIRNIYYRGHFHRLNILTVSSGLHLLKHVE